MGSLNDQLYKTCKRIEKENGELTIALLQRKLHLSYGRAEVLLVAYTNEKLNEEDDN